jgi:hypothetical protein
MVAGIKVYIEGGGETRNLQRPLKNGFQVFFKDFRESARTKGLSFNVVMCGGRSQAYDDFKIALEANKDSYNFLLVDSEAPVTKGIWQHLKERKGDGWDKIGTNDQCHLMVQCMETWFVADVEALKKVFLNDLDEAKLPDNSDLETAEKDDVQDKLNKATNGKYHKRNKAKDILEELNPEVVRKLKHGKRFFETLENTIRDH